MLPRAGTVRHRRRGHSRCVADGGELLGLTLGAGPAQGSWPSGVAVWRLTGRLITPALAVTADAVTEYYLRAQAHHLFVFGEGIINKRSRGVQGHPGARVAQSIQIKLGSLHCLQAALTPLLVSRNKTIDWRGTFLKLSNCSVCTTLQETPDLNFYFRWIFGIMIRIRHRLYDHDKVAEDDKICEHEFVSSKKKVQSYTRI